MRLERLGFVVVMTALLACGKIEASPGDPAGTDPTGPPPPTAGPVAPADAGVAAPRHRGGVTMISGSGAFSASAEFPKDTAPLGPAPTTPCKLTLFEQDTSSPSPSDSAGNIEIEVEGKSGPLASTLSFDASTKAYEPVVLNAAKGEDRLEAAGTPIRVRAKGAGVPAFEATVLAGSDSKIIEPAEGTVLTKSSSDLLVRWTADSTSNELVSLQGTDGTIACSFPASAREGVVPGALIQQLLASGNDAGCKGDCLVLDIRSFRSSKVIAGDYDISILHVTGDRRALTAE